MPVRSKWQSLPTEAINRSSLGIDKLQADDIVDLMINEDRKMLAAVQRERERIAVGIEMIASALRKDGRVMLVGAGIVLASNIYIAHREARLARHATTDPDIGADTPSPR